MSLSRFKFDSLSVRLIVGFFLFFVVSSAIMFFFVYGLFSKSLIERDQGFLEAKAQEYVAVFQKGGLPLLSQTVKEDDLHDILVRVEDVNRKTDFLHIPKIAKRLTPLALEAKLKTASQKWTDILAKSDNDSFEVLTVPLGSTERLQIGRSIDNRNDLLERLMDIFLTALLLMVGIGSIAGIFFANRTLAPLRDLIGTVRTIRSGDIKARVPARRSQDELGILIEQFNGMLNRIEMLFNGMQGTLDDLSHELKTPMTRLKSVAELALHGPKDTEKYGEALATCLEQSHEIIRVLNLLMDISEAEAGAIKLEFEKFDAHKLLLEVVDLYEIVAEEKQVTLTIAAHPGLVVTADRLRLKRALANVVDNAIKYSPNNSTVTISILKGESAVVFAVEDFGCGITDSDLNKVWERLYRGDHSRSSPGLGLGLSFVRSIVKAHGGSSEIESEWGKGSTVYLEIPSIIDPDLT